MSRETQECKFSINKTKHGVEPSKLDPIIAVLEDYVRAVEKYEGRGVQSVTQHHKDNIALLKSWGRQSFH